METSTSHQIMSHNWLMINIPDSEFHANWMMPRQPSVWLLLKDVCFLKKKKEIKTR